MTASKSSGPKSTGMTDTGTDDTGPTNAHATEDVSDAEMASASDPDPLGVLVVCHGNICRSPIGMVVLTDRLRDAGLEDAVRVTSAGVSNEEEGNPIDPRAADVLRSAGYGVPDDHVAHRIRPGEIPGNDLVLAMTTTHERGVLDVARKEGLTVLTGQDVDSGKRARHGESVEVRMWREFDPEAPARSGSGRDLDVPDPWYGGAEDFEETLATVERAADSIVEHLRRMRG